MGFHLPIGLRRCCCGALLLLSGPSGAIAREWTDNTGQFRVEAEFDSLQGDRAYLRRADGKLITVPLNRLSSPDRQLAAQLAAAKQAEELAAAAKKHSEELAATKRAEELAAAQQAEKLAAAQQAEDLARRAAQIADRTPRSVLVQTRSVTSAALTTVETPLVARLDVGVEIAVAGELALGPPAAELAPVLMPLLTADETVRYVTAEFAAHRPRAVWEALPASHQQEITELIHGFAAQMDPQIWNAGCKLLRKTARVLQEKRTFILGHPLFAEELTGTDPQSTAAAWEATVQVLTTLANSDLADLQKLRRLEVGRFLDTTGQQVMQQLASASRISREDAFNQSLQLISQMQVTLVNSDGETAVVRLESGDSSTENQMVLVEGKWIPADLAEQLPQGFALARTALAELDPQHFSAHKEAVKGAMRMVNSVLESLLRVENQQQFDSLIAGLADLIAGPSETSTAAAVQPEK